MAPRIDELPPVPPRSVEHRIVNPEDPNGQMIDVVSPAINTKRRVTGRSAGKGATIDGYPQRVKRPFRTCTFIFTAAVSLNPNAPSLTQPN
jgi:hypothetical protein